MAFVLPGTALTGSRWRRIRELLLKEFAVEWVVVSHDARSRPAKGGLPGRLYVGFSESTRIAEALIVATEGGRSDREAGRYVRFVNLRRNPDQPIDAMAVAKALLSLSPPGGAQGLPEVAIGGTPWGEVATVAQDDLGGDPWVHATFVQGRLVEAALGLVREGVLAVGRDRVRIPVAGLGEVCDLGPYHMQVKSPTHGLFRIVAAADPTRAGHPALWHHSAARITGLETEANARLQPRADRDRGLRPQCLPEAAACIWLASFGTPPSDWRPSSRTSLCWGLGRGPP